MFDTLTPLSTPCDFNTMARARFDPGGFLTETRSGAREAAVHMKNLAERFAKLRNAVMRWPDNLSYACSSILKNKLMSSRGSLDDVFIAIIEANDAAL